MAEAPFPTGGAPARFAATIVRLRWLWVVMALALLGASMAGLANLKFDPSARQFFAEENPDRIALDEFEAAFAKDENLIFALAPKSGNVFTPEMLALQGRLT